MGTTSFSTELEQNGAHDASNLNMEHQIKRPATNDLFLQAMKILLQAAAQGNDADEKMNLLLCPEGSENQSSEGSTKPQSCANFNALLGSKDPCKGVLGRDADSSIASQTVGSSEVAQVSVSQAVNGSQGRTDGD